MWGEDEKARFRKGFTGQDQKKKKKKGLSFQERHKLRMANMSDSEKAERQAKIDKEKSRRGYEDGGVLEKKSFFGKLKDKLKKK